MKVFFAIILLVGCQNKIKNTSVTGSSLIYTENNNDTLYLRGTKYISKNFQNCALVEDSILKDETIFINSNIKFYIYDTINVKELSDSLFYQSLLTESGFLEFEEGVFNNTESKFITKFIYIKDYGNCFIGQYYFPTASNSAQHRTTIVTNPSKKEISIWNFENVLVKNANIFCEFSVRGKIKKNLLKYLELCNKFIISQ